VKAKFGGSVWSKTRPRRQLKRCWSSSTIPWSWSNRSASWASSLCSGATSPAPTQGAAPEVGMFPDFW